MEGQKHVLLIWWYTRKDLTEPLLSLSDAYTYTGLYFHSKEEEGADSFFTYPRKYWSDYRTPSQLLDDIRPDLIVFMGLESAKVIATRILAGKRGIPCVMVEHGVKNDATWFENNLGTTYSPGKNIVKRITQKGRDFTRTLAFSLDGMKGASFRLKQNLLRLMYASLKWPYELALQKNPFPERTPDKYFLLAPFQAEFYHARDRADERQLVSIGSIYFDSFFREYQSMAHADPVVKRPYAFIIDQPVLEISVAERMSLYVTLRDRLKERGLHLVIKLHPDDYGNTALEPYMRDMGDITWLRQTHIPNLVYHAACCFSFYSTLLIPVIYIKPTFIFNIADVSYVNDWIAMKVVTPVLPSELHRLNGALQHLDEDRGAAREAYFRKYLYSVDGDALGRLRSGIAKLIQGDRS